MKCGAWVAVRTAGASGSDSRCSGRPAFCRGAPSLLPVLLGAGGAAGFARYRGVRAVPAESKGFGLTPLFLGKEPFLLPALRGLVPSAVVLATTLLGFHFGGGRFRAGLRLFGLSWRDAGGAFSCSLPLLFRRSWRATTPVPRFRQREGELESSSFHPPARGNPLMFLGLAALVGSIPAWAGEPGTASALQPQVGVYPRVGGLT